MKILIQALRIVFREKKNVFLGIASALFFGGVFLFGSGMITFYPTGPYIELLPAKVLTFAALTLFSGITIPVQIYAVRKAGAGLKSGVQGVGGLLAGMAAMSCCAPLLFPAILSFIGFSGTQLLFFNIAARKYALYLSLISIGLLAMSLLMAARSISATCRIPLPKNEKDDH